MVVIPEEVEAAVDLAEGAGLAEEEEEAVAVALLEDGNYEIINRF